MGLYPNGTPFATFYLYPCNLSHATRIEHIEYTLNGAIQLSSQKCPSQGNNREIRKASWNREMRFIENVIKVWYDSRLVQLLTKFNGGWHTSTISFFLTSTKVANQNCYYKQYQAAPESGQHRLQNRRLECNWSLQTCGIKKALRHGAVHADGRIVPLRHVRSRSSNFGKVKEVLIENVTPSRGADSMLTASII